jgi:toxin ParE1/3/4
MKLVISPRARADLQDIGDYIAGDNPSRALSFVNDIAERCRMIARMPRAARLRPELGEGVRVAPFRAYLIVYVLDEAVGVLRIERVLHGARSSGGES